MLSSTFIIVPTPVSSSNNKLRLWICVSETPSQPCSFCPRRRSLYASIANISLALSRAIPWVELQEASTDRVEGMAVMVDIKAHSRPSTIQMAVFMRDLELVVWKMVQQAKGPLWRNPHTSPPLAVQQQRATTTVARLIVPLECVPSIHETEEHLRTATRSLTETLTKKIHGIARNTDKSQLDPIRSINTTTIWVRALLSSQAPARMIFSDRLRVLVVGTVSEKLRIH